MKWLSLATCFFYVFSLIPSFALAQKFAEIHKQAKIVERKIASMPEVTQFKQDGKKYYVENRKHPNSKSKEKIKVTSDLTEFELDTNADGKPDYHEIKKKNVTIKTYDPAQGIYRQVKIETRQKDGIETTHMIFNPKKQGYIVINRSFRPYLVLNAEVETKIIVETGDANADQCSLNSETTDLADEMIDILTSISSETELVRQIKEAKGMIDPSCKEGDFKKSSFTTLAKAVGNVLDARNNSEGKPQYLQCLEDNRLPVYAARIRAQILEHMKDPAAKPLIQCKKENGISIGEYNERKDQITFFKPAEQLSSKFLSSHYYDQADLEVPDIPQGELAQKNYEKLFFHEMIHAAGITTERFTHAIEECCGNPSSPNSKACKEMGEYIANENTLNSFDSFLGKTDAYAHFADYGKSLFKYEEEYKTYRMDVARDLYTLHAKHNREYDNCTKSPQACRDEYEKNISAEMTPLAMASCEDRTKSWTSLPVGRNCKALTEKFQAVIKEMVSETPNPRGPQDIIRMPGPVCPIDAYGRPLTNFQFFFKFFSYPMVLIGTSSLALAQNDCSEQVDYSPRRTHLPNDTDSPKLPDQSIVRPPRRPYEQPPASERNPILRENSNSLYQQPVSTSSSYRTPKLGSMDNRQDILSDTRRSSTLVDSLANFAKSAGRAASQLALPAAMANSTRDKRNSFSGNSAFFPGAPASSPARTNSAIPSQNFNKEEKTDLNVAPPATLNASKTASPPAAQKSVAGSANQNPPPNASPANKGLADSTTTLEDKTAQRKPAAKNEPATAASPPLETYTRAQAIKIITTSTNLNEELKKTTFVLSLIENKIQIIKSNGDVVGSKSPQLTYRWDSKTNKYKQENL